MKVCSVYGAGFYFIPGTDTCIKVGGYVRMDLGINANGSHAPYLSGGAARDTRADTPYYNARTRAVISMDARSQTEWGTLRAYIRAGWEMNSNTSAYGVANLDTAYRGATYWDRAFIQFAGLTVGKTQSFFDFYANAANYTTSIVGGSDTNHGIELLAYTFQFGGGFSGTISLEDTNHRRTGIWNNATALAAGAAMGGTPSSYGAYAAATYPDVVANLRVDQPWGSAQIMGALHNVNASTPATVTSLNNGPDGMGWAAGAGVMFNLPFARGDQMWVQATFARGAASYIGLNKFTGNDGIAMYSGGLPGAGGGNVGLGWALDAVVGADGSLNMTNGFQVNAAVQHFWTPSLRSSVFGGYVQLNYDNSATAAFCSGTMTGIQAPGTGGRAGTCDPSYNLWQVGTRTVWSPVRNLDIGVEVLYTKFDSKMVGNWTLPASGSRPAGDYAAASQDTWSGQIRFQRNFWP